MKEEPETVLVKSDCSKKCSDYDSECKDVTDHAYCWMGTWGVGRADGLCPFIHNEN